MKRPNETFATATQNWNTMKTKKLNECRKRTAECVRVRNEGKKQQINAN